jgi:hypothetical protein
MGRYAVIGLFCGIAAILAGCGPLPPSVGSLRAEACQAESGVGGSYNYSGADAIPEVRPLPGNSVLVAGTAEGAATLNACIRAKAAAGQTDGRVAPNAATAPATPVSTAPQQSAAAFGASYDSCVFEPGTTGAYIVTGRSGVPVARRTTGGSQQAVDALNACIQSRIATNTAAPRTSGPAVVTETQLPAVAGVRQTVVSETTGTSTTSTFTYGTPPASVAATPASGRAPARQCNLQMTGGTGYSCAIR